MITIPPRQKAGAPWRNEEGLIIPTDLIKKVDKVNEAATHRIASKALKASNMLRDLLTDIKKEVQVCIDAFHEQYEGSKKVFKGNYTIDNYDGSIRITVRVNVPLQFESKLIQEAQNLLKEFLNGNISSKNDFIKQMVLDAFETSRGKLDVRKIMSLTRYTSQIADPTYTRAMDLIIQAQRRPESKIYYQVSVKDESGEYQAISLNIADM